MNDLHELHELDNIAHAAMSALEYVQRDGRQLLGHRFDEWLDTAIDNWHFDTPNARVND